MGSYPSGQRGLTVNQLSDDFGGSNPSPPTCARKSLALPVACWQEARLALIAQSAEHTLGKGEVMGSNLIEGSIVAKNFFSIDVKENRKWRRQNMTEANRI